METKHQKVKLPTDELFGIFFDWTGDDDEPMLPSKPGKASRGGGKRSKNYPSAGTAASRPRGGKAAGVSKQGKGKQQAAALDALPGYDLVEQGVRTNTSGVSRQSTRPESVHASSSRSSSPTEVLTQGQLSASASPTRDSLVASRKGASGKAGKLHAVPRPALSGKRPRTAAEKGAAAQAVKRTKCGTTSVQRSELGGGSSGEESGSLLEGLAALEAPSVADLAALVDSAGGGLLAIDFPEHEARSDDCTPLGLLSPGSFLADVDTPTPLLGPVVSMEV